MELIFEYDTEKLCHLIEELDLDLRSYHVIKRARCNYIFDVTLMGKDAILRLHNAGPKVTNTILLATANYLGVPVNSLFNAEIYEASLLAKQKPTNPLSNSIRVLDVQPDIIKLLETMKIHRISDLIGYTLQLSENKPDNDASISVDQLRKINRSLNQFFKKVNLTEIIIEPKHEIAQDVVEKTVPLTYHNLTYVLDLVFRNERHVQIIRLRTLKLETLEEIALQSGGVTRERIRQIIALLSGNIKKYLSIIFPICLKIENKISDFKANIKTSTLTAQTVIDYLSEQLPELNIAASEEDILNLIAIVRLLTINGEAWGIDFVEGSIPNFSYVACCIDPPVKQNIEVGNLIATQKKNRNVPYREIARQILQEANHPLHWLKIVERAYQVGYRDNLNSTALFNVLLQFKDIFVRVDAGTYALVEAGYSEVENYSDIIANILKAEKKPLSQDVIQTRVDKERMIKISTLIMLLSMHPRFYKSRENTYGLRAWLPPREKQTLRTPEWLVEDSDSYKRIEQSDQHGYDVENIVSKDFN